MLKRFFVAAVCAVALFTSAPAQAAPILTTDADTLIGTVFFDLALNPVAMALAPLSGSTVAVTDGGPITTGVIGAFDDNTALFIDFGFDDIFVFEFNFATSVFGANTWSMVVDGIPVMLSDPGLVPFFGSNLGQFSALSFDPFITQDIHVGYLGVYALDFIAAQDVTAVPEPATIGLVAMGLAAAVRRRRQQRKNT